MRIKNAVKFLYDPCTRFSVLNSRGFYKNVPDDKFLKMAYKARMGKTLNLEDPKTFNEKLQWLKLYDRKPIYTTMVDKFEAKKYVASIIGEEYIIPTLGVWDSVDDIDFNALPNQFVLKCTHDCGGLAICRDKKQFDKDAARKKIERSLKHNYYWNCREWPYKNVKPRIIAEQYMQDGNTKNLNVYKVFNFSGVPTIIQTIQNDKTPYETIDYFDSKWNLLKLKQNFPNSKNPLKRPNTLDQILALSSKCSADFPFLRTDWYEVNGQVYFSEFTFYTDAGFAKFYPEEWDFKLGNLLDLSGLQATKSTS